MPMKQIVRTVKTLSIAILTILCVLCNQAFGQDRPPNILFILADDLGWGDVGFNGRREWRTPNLDRLAKQGTTFGRWYAAGVVCAPSRAALMTGKYTIHCGVSRNYEDLPSEEVTIPEALRTRGYATALFGKWHHGKPRVGQASYVHPLDHGFDEFFGFTDAQHAWEHFPRELWFGREKRPVKGHSDTMFVDRSIEFAQRNRERPFFIYLSLNSPHFHVEAPAEDVAAYKGKFAEKDPARPVNATYAAMIAKMDKEIGRLLRALDDAGLAKNTLIVFTSDHGATFETGNYGAAAFHDSNHPFRGGKRTLWEGGIRVPALVRWPSHVPAGKTSDEIVHMTDVLPTLLNAAGGAPDPTWKVDGANLLDVWRGKEKSPDRTLFWEWRAEGYNQLAAMRGDHKLVLMGDNKPELFNVATDPAERRNIIAEHPPLATQLQRELKDWLASEPYASTSETKK